jgi:hypothetical protein
MKFNKWTVGLAAVGVVSLTSAAKAEEKANLVQTALASTTLSGYVDTSAQWNPGTGNEYTPPYRFGGLGKADGFNLNVVQVRLEKALDESEWAAGYRVTLWAGPDANTLGTQSSGSSSDFAIRDAYVALRTPVGNGIDWKMGVFDSIVGYESIESPSNPNYTRSYGNSIEPTTHTGILASYRINDMISFSAGIADTVGPMINERAFYPMQPVDVAKAESYKSYMGSIALTAPDSMGFLAGSTLYGGIVTGFSSGLEENQNSWYAGATVATPVTGLRAGVAFDYLQPHNSSIYSYAFGGYLSYQATEKLSLHGRAEYYKEHPDNVTGQGTLFGAHVEVMALTATAQYDLWKNVISRLEVRWDHSLDDEHIFGGNSTTGLPDADNAWMIAANLIYKF